MGARGRKSAASLVAVTPIGERLLMCRPEASDDVRAVFARLVADVGADYFRASDADLIEQYAAAICLARDAYDHLRDGGPVKDGRVNPWQDGLGKGEPGFSIPIPASQAGAAVAPGPEDRRSQQSRRLCL